MKSRATPTAIRIVHSTDLNEVARLLSATRIHDAKVSRRARAIVRAVREDGDAALTRFARELDHATGPLEIRRREWARAARQVPAEVRRALDLAAAHIEKVAKAQLPKPRRTHVRHGITIEQRVVPLDRVGCYVPGGRYPLPSSLLMSAIPARVAGVHEIIAVCPQRHPVVLAAALTAGVDRFFQMGGAHAVAALAYGTTSVPRVDKIVGPGNQYVAAAKALVSADCAIDFHAGPSEILIVSATGRPDWIAADLIAQAEHDPDARAVLITPNRALAVAVQQHVEALLPREGPAATALGRHGGIVIVGSSAEALRLANHAAPEHLVVDDERMAKLVRAAGAVFVGPWSAQVAGDYALGSNHVLPTAGAARFRGGLSAADFVRVVSVQRVSQRGLAAIRNTVTALASAEGLDAHARSIDARFGGANTGARRAVRPFNPGKKRATT